MKKHRHQEVKVTTLTPKVETQEPQVQRQGDYYVKKLQACPKCKRTQLDDSGRAVVCTSSGKEIAYFRCRACEHRWKLLVI